MAGNALDFAREIFDVFGRGDIARFQEMLDENVDWHEADGLLWGGRYHGRDEVMQRGIAPIAEHIDNFTVTPEEFIGGDGDTVAVRVRFGGTGRQTGKQMDLPALMRLEVRDGKLVRYDDYVDTVLFNETVPNPRAAKPAIA